MSGGLVSTSLLSLPTNRKSVLCPTFQDSQSNGKSQWKRVFLAWSAVWVPDLHPPLFTSCPYTFGSCPNNWFQKRNPFADSLSFALQLGAAHVPDGTSHVSAAVGAKAALPSRWCVLGIPGCQLARVYLHMLPSHLWMAVYTLARGEGYGTAPRTSEPQL